MDENSSTRKWDSIVLEKDSIGVLDGAWDPVAVVL